MKVSVIVAMVALLAVSTSAVPSWRQNAKSVHGDDVQIAGGSNNNAGVSGLANNLAEGGVLAQNGKVSDIKQIKH